MKILVSAYLDNNIGDDLMIKLLADRFPKHDFYLCTSNTLVSKTFSDQSNIHFIFDDIYTLETTDFSGFIKIGGSMFIVETLVHVRQRLKELKLLKKLKKEKKFLAVIGSNYGPFKNKHFERLVKKELSFYDLITVRDEESFQRLREYKLNKNSFLFDDIVYNMNIKGTDGAKKSNVLGISAYRSAKKELNLNEYEFLATLAERFIESGKNNKVNLYAFDSENENDLVACYHIKELCKYGDEISIIPYLGNSRNFLKRFQECSQFIAIRFHSAVLCDLYDIPFFAIAYSNKMINLINDSNQNLSFMQLKDISHKIIYESNIYGKILEASSENLLGKKEKNSSAGHFIELEKLFENKVNNKVDINGK